MTRGLVVVLGRTGRNFAAGMSGGIAYVLDDDGTFAIRCNTSMVGLGPLTADDAREVRTLVERHHEHTQSTLAERLLADWPAAVARFVKVLPQEYAKVLARAHLDTDEARVAAV
jgi:glutamate synthase domain-containing protein 3